MTAECADQYNFPLKSGRALLSFIFLFLPWRALNSKRFNGSVNNLSCRSFLQNKTQNSRQKHLKYGVSPDLKWQQYLLHLPFVLLEEKSLHMPALSLIVRKIDRAGWVWLQTHVLTTAIGFALLRALLTERSTSAFLSQKLVGKLSRDAKCLVSPLPRGRKKYANPSLFIYKIQPPWKKKSGLQH